MSAVKWELLGPEYGFDDRDCERADKLDPDLEFSAYARDDEWSVHSIEFDDIESGAASNREEAKRACVEAVARELARRKELAASFANGPATAESLDRFVRTHAHAVLSALADGDDRRIALENRVVWLHAEKGRPVATVTTADDARVLLCVARNNTEGLDHEVPPGCCCIVARFGEHTLMGAFSLAELNAAREVRL